MYIVINSYFYFQGAPSSSVHMKNLVLVKTSQNENQFSVKIKKEFNEDKSQGNIKIYIKIKSTIKFLKTLKEDKIQVKNAFIVIKNIKRVPCKSDNLKTKIGFSKIRYRIQSGVALLMAGIHNSVFLVRKGCVLIHWNMLQLNILVMSGILNRFLIPLSTSYGCGRWSWCGWGSGERVDGGLTLLVFSGCGITACVLMHDAMASKTRKQVTCEMRNLGCGKWWQKSWILGAIIHMMSHIHMSYDDHCGVYQAKHEQSNLQIKVDLGCTITVCLHVHGLDVHANTAYAPDHVHYEQNDGKCVGLINLPMTHLHSVDTKLQLNTVGVVQIQVLGPVRVTSRSMHSEINCDHNELIDILN